MLPPPPTTVGALESFPTRPVPDDYPYARIHDQWKEPEWFCSDGGCRFDPPPGEPFGTCYVAGNPLGAFVERFGRLKAVPRRLVDQKVLSNLQLPSPVMVADATNRQLVGDFGLTAELWAGDDYEGSQRWAAALYRAGFAGIWYPCRHDVQGDLHALAMFGKPGFQPAQMLATSEPQPIPTTLLDRAELEFGIQIIE